MWLLQTKNNFIWRFQLCMWCVNIKVNCAGVFWNIHVWMDRRRCCMIILTENTFIFFNTTMHTVNSCELNICAYCTHKCVCFSSSFHDICTKLSEYVNGLCRMNIWYVHSCREPPNKAIKVLKKVIFGGWVYLIFFFYNNNHTKIEKFKEKNLLHPPPKYPKNGLIYSAW